MFPYSRNSNSLLNNSKPDQTSPPTPQTTPQLSTKKMRIYLNESLNPKYYMLSMGRHRENPQGKKFGDHIIAGYLVEFFPCENRPVGEVPNSFMFAQNS